MRTRTRIAAAAAAAMALGAAPAQAETIYGLTAADALVTFSSTSPGAVSTPLPVTGLQPGESLVGIDYRPATLQLAGITDAGRIYRIDTVTGAAALLSTATTPPAGTAFGVDFNPTVDRLRVVSDSDQNLRINPNTGATTIDGALAFNAGDANAGDDPAVVAEAYTNNFPSSATYPAAATTTLYGIEAGNDVLVTQNPPNNGTLNTVGALGVDLTTVAGLDIVTAPQGGANTAYLLGRVGAAANRLYTVDLATGAATAIGALPAAGDQVEDIAVAPAIPTFVALTTGTPQGLVTFRADRPEAATQPVAISGLALGERLIGIDTRPATGALFAVGTSNRIYSLDPATGAATEVNPFSQALSGTAFGVDFNPVPDRLRVVSDAEYNGRLNPNAGGASVADVPLAYKAGDPRAGQDPTITAAAYTNAFAGAVSTLLFDLDTGFDSLVLQEDPNNGVLATVGPLAINQTAAAATFLAPTNVNGFDIVPRFNHQFAALHNDGAAVSRLHAVYAANPVTVNGTPTVVTAPVGTIGLPSDRLAEGLTVLNGDRISLGAASVSADEGAGAVTLSLVRSGGADAPAATVRVTTADGTATAGADYAALDTTVRFAPGETVKTVTVALLDDAAFEGDETLRVVLSAPTGGAAVGSPGSAAVRIDENDAAPVATATATATPTATPAATATPVATPYRIRVAPRLSVTVRPKRDRTFPYRFTTTGRVIVPSPLTTASCRGARVSIQIKVKGRNTTLSTRRVTLTSTCRFSRRVTFAVKRRLPRAGGTLQFTVRFAGTPDLLPVRVVRTARIG